MSKSYFCQLMEICFLSISSIWRRSFRATMQQEGSPRPFFGCCLDHYSQVSSHRKFFFEKRGFVHYNLCADSTIALLLMVSNGYTRNSVPFLLVKPKWRYSISWFLLKFITKADKKYLLTVCWWTTDILLLLYRYLTNNQKKK